MKTIFTLFSFLILSAICITEVNAQTLIPNGGFETWQDVGKKKEEPTNWNSNKNGGGVANLGPQTCFRESSGAYAGSYCLKVETKTYFGTPVNGTATTGKIEAPNTNPLNGYIHTVRGDSDFNSPFAGRPDSLVGYFKYTSVNGDEGKIEVILHGDFNVSSPDQGGSASHIVGVATYLTPTSSVGGWTRFSVPFVYNNSNTPNYILAVATSSSTAGAGEKGSILWLDELQAIYNPPCAPTSETLVASACDTYTSPSGRYSWNTTGMYTDTLTNAAGCDSILTIDLTIDPVDISVSQNVNVLTAGAASASFQWLDCDNGYTAISGATGQTFTASAPGTFAVEVTQNSCTDTSTCVDVMTVGLDPYAFADGISIYPNPGENVIILDLGGKLLNPEVSMINMQGQVVMRRTFSQSRSLEMEVADLVSGMYMIRIQAEEKVALKKWVKK